MEIDIERIIINTIKLNCQQQIQSEPLWIISNFDETIDKGIYFNLLNKDIKLLNLNKTQLIENIKNDYSSIFPQPKSTFIERTLNYLTSHDMNCITRLQNFKKLIEEVDSEKSDLKFRLVKFDKGSYYIMKSKEDGDNFYRSIVNSFVLKIIDKGLLDKFITLLIDIQEEKNAYKISKCKNELGLAIKILKEINGVFHKTKATVLTLLSFFLFVNLLPQFEIGLIRILRELIFQFTKKSTGYIYNGVKLKDWIENTESSFSDFGNNIIRKIGVRETNLIINIIPLVLGINLNIYTINSREIDQKIILCLQNESQVYKNNFYTFGLTSEEIILLNMNDKYIILIEATSSMKEFKVFGSKNLKEFESFIQNKIKNENKNVNENSKKMNKEVQVNNHNVIEKFSIISNPINELKKTILIEHHFEDTKNTSKRDEEKKIEKSFSPENRSIINNKEILSKDSKYEKYIPKTIDDPRLKCTNCKNIKFVTFGCQHSLCIYCLKQPNNSYEDNSFFNTITCNQCNTNQIICQLKLSCKCEFGIQEIDNCVSTLVVSFIYSNSQSFNYACPKCKSQIAVDEVSFFFFKKIHKDQEYNKLTKIVLCKINQFSSKYVTCDICSDFRNPAFKLYNCKCSAVCCYFCLLLLNFDVQKLPRCKLCSNSLFNLKFLEFFQHCCNCNLYKIKNGLLQNISTSISIMEKGLGKVKGS